MTFRAPRFASRWSAARGCLRLERDRGDRPDVENPGVRRQPDRRVRPAVRAELPGAARKAPARRRDRRACHQWRPVRRHDGGRAGAARLVARRQAGSRDPRTRRQRHAARHPPGERARQSRQDDREDQGERRQAAARRDAGFAELGQKIRRGIQPHLSRACAGARGGALSVFSRGCGDEAGPQSAGRSPPERARRGPDRRAHRADVAELLGERS